MELRKTFNFGKIAYDQPNRKTNSVDVEIELRDTAKGPAFSARGFIWNASHTYTKSGGQNLDTIAQYVRDPLFQTILGWWFKWHLNMLNAGTPEQTAAINKWMAYGHRYSYDEACQYLKSIGLYEVPHPTRKGETYQYGHEWLYRPIDKADLKAMKELLA